MSHNCFSSFQEGARRFEKAMRGIPDRVPVCAQMHEFAMQEIGATATEFYTTPGMLTAATLEIQQKYGIDVPVLDYDVYNIEAEAQSVHNLEAMLTNTGKHIFLGADSPRALNVMVELAACCTGGKDFF